MLQIVSLKPFGHQWLHARLMCLLINTLQAVRPHLFFLLLLLLQRPGESMLHPHLQVVYTAAIALDDPRWAEIPALAALIQRALRAHEQDGIVRDAELTIRATPLTDITYLIGGKERSIAVIGYTNVVAADWGFYDWRTIALVAGGVLAIVVITIAVLSLR